MKARTKARRCGAPMAPGAPSNPSLPAPASLGQGQEVADPGTELSPIGVAQRVAEAGGRERWQLPPSHADAAARLLELGRAGIGGFVEGSAQGDAPHLVRASAQIRLPALLGTHEGHPLPWQPVVEMGVGLARALAAAEAHDCFPGALRPRNVVIEPELWIVADQVVAEALGTEHQPPLEAELRREWLTPASVEGQPEDHASNRWLLGLLMYRLLSGRGPFAGLGLRSAMDRLASGVPPLPEALARELPPGLQSLILRILSPDPSARPDSAASLLAQLERFSAPAAAPSGDADPAPPRPTPPPAVHTPAPAPAPAALPRPASAPVLSRHARRRLLRGSLALIALLLGLAGSRALSRLAPPSADKSAAATTPKLEGSPPVVGKVAPLDAAHTTPEDCASCHPRQTTEWKRSVMGHSAKSPLFQALEILIEEQAGRSDDCPGGAGILRTADPRTACRNPVNGAPITGSGGALWCANCHTPRENLAAVLPAWDGSSTNSASRLPLRDLQPATTTEGIDCGFCHQVHGPVQPGNERAGLYEGNPSWVNFESQRRFEMRPEDRAGIPGIANSGYFLDPAEFLADAPGRPAAALVPGGVHRRPSDAAKRYLASSQFCGACHDVRLFGADAIATPERNEHFRRLRNAYSEWANWASAEAREGREPADCQDCHMSSFPGVCVAGDPPAPVAGETDITALRRGCPPGTHFESRAPGERPELRVAAGSGERSSVSTHYFSGVDIPLTPEFDDNYIDQPELDAAGIPLGGHQRRDLLLGRSFRFELGEAAVRGRTLELPIQIENTGAGHKIPAGFSQEREFWVHLRVTDSTGRVLYEVGRVERGDEDLRDKIFVDVNVDDRRRNGAGQPLGVFGANVIDGPDVPQWEALDGDGGAHSFATRFRGRGLINLQNGFLRCVSCIGRVDGRGECQPVNAAQASHRAARFTDAQFDNDTGQCISNLNPDQALFETYFPVGSLDAERGIVKGPDAIIDIRSAPPGVPLQWTYELPLVAANGPLKIEARLLFRAFPPFLVKTFADYEARQAALGLRPSGPLVTREMLAKLEVVEIARVEKTVDGP